MANIKTQAPVTVPKVKKEIRIISHRNIQSDGKLVHKHEVKSLKNALFK